ncbi:HlyD family secretion protein [Sphingorhabdus sp. 109]|jgi:membrane fusion protein (multidrug efflux system)|uniref:HlyD family secretion protein n=1 Tax=Sphingorhabdus sp. 109 TaxID=2653173 RepID=UPI0012EF8E69|nr:HlyD family secretion protein [Sphingorhabdus sp. 109]VWX57269.1 Multidrug ABC transporter permease [Sphingorhabdus sp. 109]
MTETPLQTSSPSSHKRNSDNPVDENQLRGDSPDADCDSAPENQSQDDHAPSVTDRSWFRPLLIVIAIVALAFGAYQFWLYQTVGKYQESTNDAFVTADDVAISSKLSGFVEKVVVAENATVDEGALLVQIRASDYANRIDAADSQIALARSNEAVTRSNIREAQAAVTAAEAEVASVQARIQYLEQQISRYRPLVASGAEPSTRLDGFTTELAQAIAARRGNQAAVNQARQRVMSLQAQTGAAQAQIQAARVDRSRARDDLSDTKLTAPVGGRVGSLAARAGQFVQPGQRLMTIVPTGDIYVTANFKETQIGLMRPGQSASIVADALPGVEFRGVVESITPGTGANFSLIPPQNATGNFTKIVQRVPVRLRIEAGPESRRILVPGLSLEVSVDTRSGRDSVAAIEREQAGDR